ncbi:glycosyltransferase family 2 protein [Rhodobacterales bacterium]|nr:glycosyltransferase family 2 protein [Rhodobacterales bacterium]
MLEALGKQAEAPFDAPRFFKLTPDVFLVVWDPPHAVNAAPRLEEVSGQKFSSLASVRLARLDNRSRIVWCLAAKEASALRLKMSAGAVGSGAELSVEDTAGAPPADPFALTHLLSQNACAVLVTTLLTTWAGMFRLARSRSFISFATDLLRSVNDQPTVVDCVASTGTTCIFETLLNSECTEITSSVLLGDFGLKRLDKRACNVSYNNGKNRLFIATADLPQPPASGFLVLSGPWGLAIRRLHGENAARSLGAWWAASARKLPEIRYFLISEFGARSPAARAAVLDLQLSEPLPAKRHGILGDTTPFCAVETALAGEQGVLVGGWLRDPGGQYEGIDLLIGPDERLPLDLHSFDGVLPEAQGGYAIKRFVAFCNAGPALRHHLQPRFELRLASGERELIVPPPQPHDPAGVRAKALSVITPRHARDPVMEACMARPLAEMQENFRQSVGAPTDITFGELPVEPVVSIVIPLYRVFEFVKAQLAAFAADSWLSENAEVIYVLDSPEQATHLEDLLSGFHLLYGLPVRLVVMARNGGYALACNTGAAAAKGKHLAMVNSDVVPVEPGWLEQLCCCLKMDEDVGAVGPKLLYADNSVQHAGLKFIQDENGRWFNHHYYKGFPRKFPLAGASREVPGVTGACLIVSRDDFDTVGGFSTDFIVGDYEDSDLCLKIRKLNRKIYYLGDVELYHFERVSIKKHDDYTRGVASQYNRWLHQTRWQADIAALMASAGAREGIGSA